MVDKGSVISTLGGGMSMGAFVSSSFAKAKHTNKGSTGVELGVIVEGRSSETIGKYSEGDYTQGLMDDER